MTKNIYKITGNIFIIPLLFIYFGCKEDFSPYCEMENRYSLFCILNNQNLDQVVIAQKLHRLNEPGKMPPKTTLLLSNQYGSNYILNETTIEGNDKLSFFKASITLYRGIKYRLSLILDTVMVQWAETAVPAVYVTSVTPGKGIGSGRPGEIYTFSYKINLGPSIPEVSIVKIFIEYEITEGGATKTFSSEVPISIIITQSVPIEFNETPKWDLDPPYIECVYTGAATNGGSEYYKTVFGSTSITFPGDGFLYKLKHIPHNGKPENVRIKRGYVLSFGFEKIFYEGYLKNSPTYSVRLDQPYLPTNFGDLLEYKDGIFSVITSDTLNFNIYPEMFSSFGYKDGQ